MDFQKKLCGRVLARLEDRKINYIIVDPRNNYDVDETSNNKNLNTYEQEFKKANIVVKQRNKINKIKQELETYIGKEEFKIITKKVEDILNEKRKI